MALHNDCRARVEQSPEAKLGYVQNNRTDCNREQHAHLKNVDGSKSNDNFGLFYCIWIEFFTYAIDDELFVNHYLGHVLN